MTGTFPQSDLQHAYLLGELGDFQLGGPALFYEEYAVPADAALQPARLADAIGTLMRRHEMLRTTFAEDGFARVHEELPVPVSVEDLRGRPAASRTVAASREQLHAAGPPLRDHAPFAVRVFRLDDEHRVQVCGRLLAIDGFSGEIFAQELRALLAGEELDPIGYTYRQYRTELARRESEPAYDRARRYWLDRLDTLPPAPELPQRRGAPAPSPGPAGLTRRSRRLTAEQWAGLAARARRNRLTPTQAVAAAFGEVLRHWSKSPRFTINVMYGERAPLHPDVDRVIGNFSSTLLLAYSPGPRDRTFADRARTLRRQLMLDTQHGAYGGVAVIRELNRRAGNARAALMPVVFTSMLGVGEPDTGVFLEHLGWTRLHGRVRTPQVALDHQVFLAGGELVAQWDTADELFPDGLIDDAFDAYHRLLVRLSTEDAAWQQERIDLTPERQLAVRAKVNDTTVARPPSTLHGPFLERVRREPDREAVVTATGRVTYGELYARAAAVAADLRRRGVEPGDRVAVTLPRGVEQIAALLGTLLAGAAYVPVSPEWPARRAAAVLDIAKPAAVLDSSPPPADPGAPPPEAWAADPEALAYVIFTSGTTGTPKGVMIRHGAAANTIADINQRFAVTAGDAVLAVSDFTFDLSVYDVFGLLAAGGRVVVPDPALAREVVHLHELARRERVTVWNSVPAYLGMFVDFVRAGRQPLPELRLAMVSGDWVPVTMARDLATVAPAARCVSLGGATEASIWSNHFPVPVDPPADWASIPYGHPLANQGFHVYDADLVDRPDWVPGELYITGHGLADGYLGDAELTGRAFRTHPRTGERVYRTGDWGRYWPDGTLEFLGREDPQVKVNGFRVELGEIEAALVAQEGVTDAAVVADRSTGGVRLVAFVAHSEAGSVDAVPLATRLTGRLRQALPAYMVPAVVDVRRALPLTPNGKVDRRALAATAGTVGRGGRVEPPATPLERRLVELWTELLGGVPVGATDDFFAAGGTSLQAARLMNRIEQAFGVRLPLATLYAGGTPRDLARRLASRADAEPGQPNLAVLADTDHPPLVLVHPVGGDLLCYRGLTRAVADRHRVLGLHGDAGGDSLAELARRYVSQVRAAVGAGPYRLAGWSLGGTVAYEMARLLHAGGQRCEVVLVDPWVHPGGTGAEPATADLVTAFLVNLLDGASVPVSAPDRAAAELLEEHRHLLARSRPDLAGVETEELVELFRRFEANTRALLRHRIEPVDGVPATVVEAADGLAGPAGSYLVPLRRAWGARPGVRYHRVPGTHFTLLSGPALATTAALITTPRP